MLWEQQNFADRLIQLLEVFGYVCCGLMVVVMLLGFVPKHFSEKITMPWRRKR